MSDELFIAGAGGPLRGSVRVPGDKSIGHRAVLFNAMAEGRAVVRGAPRGLDVRSSIAVMRALGAGIEEGADGVLRIQGLAMRFAQPAAPLDCGNSGTTMRLVCGLLAGQGVEAELIGDASLSRRPMERVARPLRAMGAAIDTTDGHAPIRVHPAALRAGEHHLEVASAQVKSALVLAGLAAAGTTTVVEPVPTRDHTERMLAAMGVDCHVDGCRVTIQGPATPRAVDVDVPGDPSSAAFLLVAALVVPGSRVSVTDVCLNPGRSGFLEILARMGADLRVEERRDVGGEPVGTVTASAGALVGTEIGGAVIPAAIDELPILAVAAAFAQGTTVIRDAEELRVKESDRVATTVALLRALGGDAEERTDGLVIRGRGGLPGGGRVEGADDHRIVMSAAVAGLGSAGGARIGGAEAARVSFPEFFSALEELRR